MSLLLLYNQGAGSSSVGGAIVRHRAGDELRHGPSFTRKRFREIIAAEQALHAAEDRAKELKTAKKRALRAATKAADDAIVAVQAAESETVEQAARADLEGLAESLRAAAGAKTLSAIFAQSKAAVAFAEAVMAAIEEIEDEEEAIALLLT